MGLLKKPHDIDREDKKFVGRTHDSTKLQIISAKGSRVVDAKGRSYIDLQMGWCAGNLGWNHPTIVSRLRDFEGPYYVQPQFLYEPWVELARRLAEIAPGKLSRTFRAVGGTEAVEQALQIAMLATDRGKFVSIDGAYHGNSIAAHSIGDAELPAMLHGCKKLAPPLDAKALDRLETILKARDVAAFIMEPVVTNLAIEVPTDDFMQGLRALCDRYGTLIIFDEVACGFGRTGRMFASEHWGVEPDIMTLAKSITNGHAPLGATITTPEIADAMKGELDFYSTFGWQPIAVEAALGTLDIWRDEHIAIFDNIERRSGELASRLIAMPWKKSAEIRIKGLAIAVKIGEEYAAEVAERCRRRGLLISADEEYLMMFPALTLDDADAREALDTLERSVH